MNKVFFSVLAITFLFTACGSEEKVSDQSDQKVPVSTKEERQQQQKEFVERESAYIDTWTKRHDWDDHGKVTTGTGIRYVIYEEGEGPQAQPGLIAEVSFEIRLLDADQTLCYTSDSLGPKTFRIEQDHVESGLHEAITYMKVGDKAKIILPHYLAHGFLGDEDQIPPQATVLYNIELLNLYLPN
jgi:FKBP-type peptidyl-prolyl cis-trans isomerase FkpA